MELKEYIAIIKKRLTMLLSFVLIFTLGAFIVSFFILPDIYESATTLYVGKQIDAPDQYTYQDTLMGQIIVKDYREIAKSKTVCQSVKKELKEEYPENTVLADVLTLSDTAFSDKIEVSLRNDTRIIEIKVSDRDPLNCMLIANKTAQVFMEKAKELLKLDNVQVLDKAEQPSVPVKPNKMMNLAIGLMLGAMLGLGLIFVIEYFDNTVKTPEDVVKYANLTVIGIIPRFDVVEDMKKKVI